MCLMHGNYEDYFCKFGAKKARRLLKSPQKLRTSHQVGAGWSSPVARQAHNLKVVGSNPTPATNAKRTPQVDPAGSVAFWLMDALLFLVSIFEIDAANRRRFDWAGIIKTG